MEVNFYEEGVPPRHRRGQKTSQKKSFTHFVVTLSGGRVTNEKQANIVLLVVVFVCLILVILLFNTVILPETTVPVPSTAIPV